MAGPTLLILLLGSSPSYAQESGAGVAYEGPYAVGKTYFELERPEGQFSVTLWYPVDPEYLIAHDTPEATYAGEPTDLPWCGWGYCPLVSSDYESVGMLPTYDALPPSADGPFPLFLFSNGAQMWGMDYYPIGTAIASHGFVTGYVAHWNDWYAGGLRAERQRPAEVSAVLSYLLGRNSTEGDLLEGAIDPDLVADGGHSRGTWATLALAAGVDGVADADPRFRAAVLHDSGTTTLTRLTEEDTARVEVPTILINQECERSTSFSEIHSRLVSSRPSYRVDLTNARHVPTFAGWCEEAQLYGIVDPACEEPGILAGSEAWRLVSEYTVAFLETELATKALYADVLTPGFAMSKEDGVEFFVTEPGGDGRYTGFCNGPTDDDGVSLLPDWPAERGPFCHDGNPATLEPGRFGQSLRIDANPPTDLAGGDYVNGLDAFTLALWVKSDVTDTDAGILTTHLPDNNDSYLQLRYDAKGASSGGKPNVIKAGILLQEVGLDGNPVGDPINTGGNASQQIESSPNQQTTAWQHLALVWTSGEKLKLYIDGEEDTPSYNREPPTDGDGTPLATMITGADRFALGVGAKFDRTALGWEGLIDEVHFFDRALDAEEIEKLKDQAGIFGGEIVYYSADELLDIKGGAVQRVPDDSGNGHDADTLRLCPR